MPEPLGSDAMKESGMENITSIGVEGAILPVLM
jgi:hypothetical protein